MKVSQAIQYWTGYHKLHSKKNTLRAYHPTISKFGQHFEDRELQSLSPDEILPFLIYFAFAILHCRWPPATSILVIVQSCFTQC